MISATLFKTFYHAITIGAAFSASYYIAAIELNNLFVGCAFLFGSCCYLSIRLSYKQGNQHDKMLFSAYRLLNWCVPFVLFIGYFYNLLAGVETQAFIPYTSFEELAYLSIFALAIWPLYLLVFLIGNTVIAVTKFFIILQLPMTIAMSLLVVIMLSLSIRRLYQFKQAGTVSFSITFAIIRALAPILLCTYLLVEIAPQYFP